MIIINNKKDLQAFMEKKPVNKKIGFVPTMGCIHQGHISLIKMSKKDGCLTCVSIFVNPTQFNDKKDFISYPINEKKDLEILDKNGCEIVFLPSVNEIYPYGTKAIRKVKKYRNILCDSFRPGHFDGVTTVVSNLLNIINADFAYFGEKDYQQLKIIEELVKIEKSKTKIIPCLSIRYKNGISISSRYKFLNKEQKNKLKNISKVLINTVNSIRNNFDIKKTIFKCRSDLFKEGINKIDYIELRDNDTLKKIDKVINARLFIALYLDDIRIIDNFII